MNYAYLFVDNLNNHSYITGLNELQASVSSLKRVENYDSIYAFNNETTGKNLGYFNRENIFHKHISLSRNYSGSNNINPISILVEKIISLMNFDENEDIVLLDIDTTFKKAIPKDFWNPNYVIFDNIEYPIMQWRNLDKVLPQIPWRQFDINFNSSFNMYNTGVIYIPKKFRRELCEKALKIVDYLNDNFDSAERHGGKLDEQIALSIVCHDTYGRFGNIKFSNEYIHHHWDDKQNGINWWKKSQYKEIDYSDFITKQTQNCLDLVTANSQYLTDKVIIDVGSNIGLFSKTIANTVQYKHIHLFEPCTRYLNESKSLLRNFSNITYNNFALSDSEKTETLYKSNENVGWNTLYTKDPVQGEGFLERMEPEVINTVKLDDYYKDIDDIGFIKIDVEGYERYVLEGALNLIKKFMPYILIEVAWGTDHPEWEKNKETYKKLFEMGYEPFDLDSIKGTNDILFRPVKSIKTTPESSQPNKNKLPISAGILSWKSNQTLRNTLESYKKNGLLDLVNDITILFQEVTDEDRKIANEYKIPFVGLDENIGIGKALIILAEIARTNNILFLEHDWELIENKETTFNRLSEGINLLDSGFNVVRYRHRKNPGYPLYSVQAYKGNELTHYDASTDLMSPHLMDCIHWVENPDQQFPDKISKQGEYFISTSRWSNFTNNPCMYKKDFYLKCVYLFKEGRGKDPELYKDFAANLTHYGSVEPWKHSLEVDIGYWWSRQNFKVAQGEGLFTHNDIQKYGLAEPITHLSTEKKRSISFIFAHRPNDSWSTPLSIVKEFKRLGWKTEIYSLFDNNDNYVDDKIRNDLLATKPDIIMHLDWGQHTSPILAELRKTGAYCIMESGDDPQRFNNNFIKAKWFDLILSPDIRCVEEYRKRGYNSEWWTHFSDTNTYYPLNVEPQYIAVCSRGIENGATIIDNLVKKYPGQIINQNGFWGDEHNKFLNSGEIVLQQSRYGEITRRIFEGMSCKKLVIADKLDMSTKIQDLFVDGKDIIFYTNEEDCIEKIFYYHNNKQEAERIAENGYNKVLNNHTQQQRVEFIINKWQQYKNGQNSNT